MVYKFIVSVSESNWHSWPFEMSLSTVLMVIYEKNAFWSAAQLVTLYPAFLIHIWSNFTLELIFFKCCSNVHCGFREAVCVVHSGTWGYWSISIEDTEPLQLQLFSKLEISAAIKENSDWHWSEIHKYIEILPTNYGQDIFKWKYN